MAYLNAMVQEVKNVIEDKYRKYFASQSEMLELFRKQVDQSFELASQAVDYKIQMNSQTRKIVAEFHNKLDKYL